MAVDINDYQEIKICVYRNERYSVRDNGAVLRHARDSKQIRPTDNEWLFGTPNSKTGYMTIASVPVHRIVATAFHGEPPAENYVVDHIDTNRQNNRPENLCWRTRLENALNNPITLKKIILRCGSISAFLEDPSLLRHNRNDDPNFEWMRTVTPGEARASWERLCNWAKKQNHTTKRGSLGEWLFSVNGSSFTTQGEPEFINSETPNAVQKNLKTPSVFPCCPRESTDTPITTYASNLKIGKTFISNKYSSSILVNFALTKDETSLLIICYDQKNAILPWFLVEITHENNMFIHNTVRGYREEIGAQKALATAQGLKWNEGNSIDDFC